MLALKQSPQARAARYALMAARVEEERERPVARPTLNAVASGTIQGPRVLFPRPDGASGVFLPERAGRVDLVFEQPLYRAGLGAARQRYSAQHQIADQDYRKALADLALAVQKAYLDVLRAQGGVEQAQEGVEQARRFQKLVQQQIEAGVAKPVDAETALARVAEAETGSAQAQGGAALARLAFNRLLGRPLETPVALIPLDPPAPAAAAPDAAVARALTDRPELISLEQNLRAARAGVSLARVQTQPTLHLRGQVTEQTPTALYHEHYAAATLELRWTLLDGGKARLDTREARAQAERLAALLEDARQGVTLEVMQAWQRVRDAQGQIALARTQRESSEATVRVAETAYTVGQGTLAALQGAQDEVRAARDRELRALYDLHAAQADFDYAQGAILDRVTLPTPDAPETGRGAAH